MAEQEGKGGWSASHILLTVTLSILTGVVGYGLKYFFEPAITRTLSIAESTSENLLALDDVSVGDLVATFQLEAIPNAQIASYFRYSVKITNTGSEGVEDTRVLVQSNNQDINLVVPPNITTNPQEIGKALNVQSVPSNVPGIGDERIIPLLNPGESIEMTYAAYSQYPMISPGLVSIARKKDWEIVRLGEEPQQQQITFLDKQIVSWNGKDVITLLMFFVTLQFIFQIYIYLILQSSIVRRFMDRWSGRRGAGPRGSI